MSSSTDTVSEQAQAAMQRGASSLVDTLSRIDLQLQSARLEARRHEIALLKPVYDQRDKVLSLVPRFWQTVFGSSDGLPDLIATNELELLAHLQSLRVAHIGGVAEKDFRLELTFAANTYLKPDPGSETTLLTKEFVFDAEDVLQGEITSIPWSDPEHDLCAKAAKEGRLSLFDIFSLATPSEEENEEQTERRARLEQAVLYIADDVYVNALDYFATDVVVGGLEEVPTSVATQDVKGKSVDTVDVTGGKTHNLLASGSAKLEQYCSVHSTPLHADLQRHRSASTAAFGELLMITELEAQLLSFLVESHGIKTVLEIGCYTGYSALVFAYAGAEKIVTTELDPAHAAFARAAVDRCGKSQVIDVLEGDAHVIIADERRVGGQFDLIFIDAEKEGYLAYLETILSRNLLSPGGLILADNTLRRGHVAAAADDDNSAERLGSSPGRRAEFEAGVRAIREFNDAVAADPTLEQVILPIFDGLSLIRHRHRP